MRRFLTAPIFRHRLARPVFYGLALVITVPMAWRAYERQLPHNGFDVDNATVPVSAIVGGGPGPDGIPALTHPEMLAADDAPYADDQRILGIAGDGEARAYPIHILNWHEVVNDRLGDDPILVSWCPLCRTGIVYRRPVEDAPLEFAVSGLLYQDNLLMYDRQTDSLWSQLQGEAISGAMKGRALEPMMAAHSTWGQWRERYPQSLVLSPDTGYRRDYGIDPYSDYHRSAGVSGDGSEPARQALVIGLSHNGSARAYPFTELAKAQRKGRIEDRFAGRTLTIDYDALAGTYEIESSAPDGLKSTLAYWFAWKSFHPNTEVWRRR